MFEVHNSFIKNVWLQSQVNVYNTFGGLQLFVHIYR